jgi:hypothetical protein
MKRARLMHRPLASSWICDFLLCSEQRYREFEHRFCHAAGSEFDFLPRFFAPGAAIVVPSITTKPILTRGDGASNRRHAESTDCAVALHIDFRCFDMVSLKTRLDRGQIKAPVVGAEGVLQRHG